MASNATLTIKVGANVKDAAQQLQALGYNIESVKKKTDKANDSASIWSQTLKKGSEDNIKKLVEMGAKFLTVGTVLRTVYKGVSELVKEGMNANEEASKKINAINDAWTDIKQNLGSALLDSVSPALDTLYDKLESLKSWADKVAEEGRFMRNAQNFYDDFNNDKLDFGAFSSDEMRYWRDALQETVNDAEAGRYNWAKGEEERYNRAITTFNSLIDAQERAEQRARNLAKGEVKGETPTSKFSDVSSFISTNKTLTETYDKQHQILEYQNKINEAQALMTSLTDEEFWSQFEGDYEGDIETYSEYLQEIIDSSKEKIDELQEAAEDTSSTWQDAFSDIYSSAKSCFSGIFSFMDAYYDRQISNINNSEMAEEEKNARINELEKKKFYAEQVNSYSEAAMSYAEGMIDIWSKYASAPWVAGTLTALLTANTGLQFATISQQTYTPSLAEGGIVTSPTHAYIGEGAENEAVIPLSKLEDFVNRDSSGGTIVLNITCNGQTSETEVFHAIERAQRTGLLPNWRYV